VPYPQFDPAFTVALALVVGVLAQSLARHARLPGIVFLLAAGASLGPDGLGWVEPRSLGPGLFALVDLAVAVVLFEGGLNLEISRLRREQASIRRLVTWGALVTFVGGAAAARFFLEWDWRTSVLFGSLVVVTGPTVVGPLVSDLRLRPRVGTVLNAEGVLIDPVGALLAVLVLELVLSPAAGGWGPPARELALRVGFGALAGVAGGFLLARLLAIRRLVPEGHQNILALASVLVLFEGCEQVIDHSGILAVTVAGVVVGNLRTFADRDLREFKDQLSVMLIGLLFVLLAADVRFARVAELGVPGLLVVASLVLVVRPLCVALSTAGSDLSWRERLFVAWVAPRGIVAAAVASLVATALEEQGLAGGLELRALVFLTIASTVVLAGLTAGPVGRALDVRLPGRDVVAVLGAEGVGLALARELKEGGRPVVFLDSNPMTCRVAQEAGFQVIFGNAMEERVLRRARFEVVGTAVALTPNQTVNSAFVRRANELFQVPEALVAVEQLDSGLASDLVQRQTAKIAFDGPHDVGRWNVRFRRDQVEIEHRVFRPPETPEEAEGEKAQAGEKADKGDKGGRRERPSAGERYLMLAVRRGGRTLPMSRDYRPQDGDVLAVAVHVPDREEAHRLLAEQGFGELEKRSAPEPGAAELERAT